MWTLALLGSALEVEPLKRYRKFAVLLYVGMGWIGMIAFKPLSAYLQGGGTALLIAGGLAYIPWAYRFICGANCRITTRCGTCAC